jgi:hypothetical protein
MKTKYLLAPIVADGGLPNKEELMGKASTAITVDLTGDSVEASVRPALHYTPAILSVAGKFGSVELLADDEQLATIADAINQHLRAKERAV